MTNTPTHTSTPTATDTATQTPTSTATPTATATGTPTVTSSATPTEVAIEACAPTPLNCDSPEKSLILFRDQDDDTKDRLKFKFIKGADTEATAFGDPTTTTTYRLCLYLDGGLVDSAAVDPGSNWEGESSGYQYKNRAGNAHSITKVKLRAGKIGSPRPAKVQVQGKGANLPNPVVPLPEPFTLTVQVTNSGNSNCWGDTYTDADAVKNQAGLFLAKKP